MSRIEQASVQWHLAQILTQVRLDDREQAEAITILEHNLDTSGDWIVINLTLQALATFARTSPAVRTRLTGRLHHYQDSPYKSVASRARKLLAELGSKPPAGKTLDLPRTQKCELPGRGQELIKRRVVEPGVGDQGGQQHQFGARDGLPVQVADAARLPGPGS